MRTSIIQLFSIVAIVLASSAFSSFADTRTSEHYTSTVEVHNAGGKFSASTHYSGQSEIGTTVVGASGAGNYQSRFGLLIDDVTISVEDTLVGEDAGTVEVVISAINDSGREIQVDYATGTGTATPGVDFTAATGTAVIPPGGTQVSIFIPITDDNLVEGNETFTLTLSNPVGGSIGDGEATITIVENDMAVLTVENAAVEESVGGVNVKVLMSNPSVFPVSFAYALIDATATAGEDYTATSGRVTIPPGETTAIIPVVIIDDDFVEIDEVFEVSLSDLTGAISHAPSGFVTILDDDVAVLSITDVTVDEWVGTATLVISLSARTAAVVSFNYYTESGSAATNKDFLSRSGSIEITPGEKETVISIPILDDALVEGTELFTVILDNVTGAEVGKGTGVVTINDGGPGYDGWAIAQGLTENAGFSEDASGDGFPNSFHYAMGIPIAASVLEEYRELIPRIDPTLFANKATLLFKVPVDFPEDIILDVEESSDMQTWQPIATKDGSADWFFQFPNLVFLDEPEDGYRGVGVTSTQTFSQADPGFYRLRVRMR